jgi:hypothetical protein
MLASLAAYVDVVDVAGGEATDDEDEVVVTDGRGVSLGVEPAVGVRTDVGDAAVHAASSAASVAVVRRTRREAPQPRTGTAIDGSARDAFLVAAGPVFLADRVDAVGQGVGVLL